MATILRRANTRLLVGQYRFFAASAVHTARISDVIKQDHREIQEAYDKILSAKDHAEKIQWRNQFTWELARHSIGEELMLYPAFEKYVRDGKSMAARDREEHLMHIQEEEHEELAALEKALTPEESDAMVRSFQRTKMLTPTRSHPHAPDKPPFETVAGLMAAPLDKIRDLFRDFPKEKSYQMPPPITISHPSSTPVNTPTMATDTANEFTTANLIGLFLTLALCLLTQPWGSLVYRPPPRTAPPLAHLAFFLWRLNPVAAVAEAITTVACLGDAILQLCHRSARGSRGTPADARRRRPRRDARSRSEPTGPVAVIAVAAVVVVIPDLRKRRDTQQQDVDDVLATDQRTPQSPDDIRKTLGMSVLARKEKWTDLMATFSAFVVLLKLIVIRMPWPIRIAAIFQLAGWSSLHLVITLFHLRPLSDEAADHDHDHDDISGDAGGNITRAVRRSKALLRGLPTLIAVHVVAAPYIVYVSWRAAFTLITPHPEADQGYRIFGMVGKAERSSPALSILDGFVRLPQFFAVAMSYAPMTIMLLLPAFAVFTGFLALLRKSGRDYQGIFLPMAFGTLFLTAELVFAVLYLGADFLVHLQSFSLFQVCILFYYSSFYLCSQFAKQQPLDEPASALYVVGILAWIYVFVDLVEYYYDPAGTYKPEWLEYFG
ncbi:unnamed protein product [Parascedosporium putredinis]|uniref:Hemerythrin-like domain-containing protein n=1 Tax=Parascedosporium putredinis TaxID=1442378 RepID=A0A9P1M800_9PEZI|nr:unnamed protein product [Parascedosporium putredinis]CAI7991600.1 unnamed protein product [Parascedosporium putredinis]